MDAGDLGAIDARYDVAVSTSCAALDYVVVDTTTSAQNCVELLRRQSLGVCTFLILEKQQHLVRALQEKPHAPEGGPSLSLHASVECHLDIRPLSMRILGTDHAFSLHWYF